MKLYVINSDYINYLKEFDNKVPNVDYDEKYKLFLGKVKINNDTDIRYYIPLTSYKPKFENMADRLDFIKICDPIDETIIGAIDINNMIPVPDVAVQEFSYDLLRYNPSFETEDEKYIYYNFSMNELTYLNDIEDRIVDNAKTVFSLYRNQNDVYSNLKNRCCNYPLLQTKAFEFQDIMNNELSDLLQLVSNNLIELEDMYGNNSYSYKNKTKGKEM